MSKLNVIRRILSSDFDKKDQSLIDKLAFPLNQFIEQVVQAFNKGLTIEDNLAQFEVVSVKTTVDADGIPIDTLSFKTSVKARGLLVIDANNLVDTTPLTGAPFAQRSQNNGIITISRITGLPAGKNFSLNLLVIG